MHENQKTFKSGFIAVVGRPNAGKSTLINSVIGEHVAITSNVAQTTRHRIRAILNKPNLQAIFVDTPGFHKPVDVLGQELNEGAVQAISDCDIAVLVIDGSQPIGSGDKWVSEKLKNLKAAKICVISKLDLITDEQKLSQVSNADKLLNWDALICLSSKNTYNIDAFVTEIEHFLPLGPKWFPDNVNTDQPLEVIIAEYIREKIIRNVFEEIPHSIGIEIDDMEFVNKKNLQKIYASAYVEKKSQKGILIGKNGSLVKEISTQARLDLEKLLGCRVFLDLEVKVKKDWRKDYNQVRKFGYTVE